MNIVVIGSAQHGKDTVGRLIEKHSDLKCTASSEVAMELFMFEDVFVKHGFKTIKDAYEGRFPFRKEMFESIQRYNKEDKTRLAREVLKQGNVYLGMRDPEELYACVEEGVFDVTLGIYDPRKPLETHSKVVSVFQDSDYVIINDSSLEVLELDVIEFLRTIHQLKK